MAGDETLLDTELADLPQVLRWREWMSRVEAVIFASSTPVTAADLRRVVGQDVAVELLVEDIQAELQGRPYDLVRVANGWMFRTQSQYRSAIRVAANMKEQLLDLSEFDLAVLASIAYSQPIDREGLKDVFGKEISRDLIGRLRHRDLITTGPRSPRPGAPYTYVTTDTFLVTFDLASLRDLPDQEMLEDAGLKPQEPVQAPNIEAPEPVG